jgi:hypothetical protein
MAEQLMWMVSNRQPSVSETITANGVPVDLSASTVRFKMRPINGSTLKVDQPAVIVNAPLGQVRYDWLAADVDTAGQYLVWWEVTTSSKTQDMSEAVIEFRAHAPFTNSYVELEELKSSTELTSTSFADQDLQNAIIGASRVVDKLAGQRFYLDVDANQVRYYTASLEDELRIDPLVTFTSLTTDDDNNGVFENTWVRDTDFVLEPINATADGIPFDTIRRLSGGNFSWPSYPNRIKLTGKFGWANIPEAVKVMTTILAARYTKRLREAPFGIAGFDAIGAVVRISRSDPDIVQLLESLPTRRVLFV